MSNSGDAELMQATPRKRISSNENCSGSAEMEANKLDASSLADQIEGTTKISVRAAASMFQAMDLKSQLTAEDRGRIRKGCFYIFCFYIFFLTVLPYYMLLCVFCVFLT